MSTSILSKAGLVPLCLKVIYSAFLAVLIPVYWANYGPTNFLYFCDIALLITLYGVWVESSVAVSMAAVGIMIPQIFWCLDFAAQGFWPHAGMTGYMLDTTKPLFLRCLSLFHGWLPFLLVYLISRLGYHRRALVAWTVLGWALCLVAYFCLPPAGAHLADPNQPMNVNYVYGLDDGHPQTWMPQGLFLPLYMLLLFVLAYVPAHLILRRLFPQPLSR